MTASDHLSAIGGRGHGHATSALTDWSRMVTPSRWRPADARTDHLARGRSFQLLGCIVEGTWGWRCCRYAVRVRLRQDRPGWTGAAQDPVAGQQPVVGPAF